MTVNTSKQSHLITNSGVCNAATNMQKDLQLLDFCINNNITSALRIYSWDNISISLGRNQKDFSLPDNIKTKYTPDVTTRPTGGRAVLHVGDISYSFVVRADFLNDGSTVKKSYKEISNALISGLELLGANGLYIADSRNVYMSSAACMAVSTGADVEYKGKKLLGSAQFRKNGYILQHGSVLIDQDFNLTAEILGIPLNSINCINLQEIIGKSIDYHSFYIAIKSGFENYFGITFSE